jgi:hypothetical protein
MEPRRGVLAPELDRWRRQANADDRRTAVVRVRAGTDTARAASRLAEIGMDVTDPGAGSVIGTVSPHVLDQIGREPFVVAVEGPRGLRPLAGG